MKPVPFAYDAPARMGHALELLAEYGADAKVLAGGQSLVPLLNFRLAQPARLVDVNRIAELDYLHEEGGSLRIGALARQAALGRSPLVAERWPLLAQAVPFVGHAATRSRGTVCGSAAHADPAAELPLALALLGARFHVRSLRGARTVEADDFFLGYLTTALAPDELLVEIEVPPLPAGARTAFVEHVRVAGDFAVAGAAALVSPAGAAVGVLGVGQRPLVIGSPEEAEDAAEDGWKRSLVGALVRRALAEAA
jgi:CO/xanthine dehydrogenase FAD-binding subunit